MFDVNDEKKIVSLWNRKKCLVFLCKRKDGGIYLRAKKFTGVRTFARFNFKEKISLQINFCCSSGVGKIAIIKEKTIIDFADCSDYKIELDEGKYRLRLVGEKADATAMIKKL